MKSRGLTKDTAQIRREQRGREGCRHHTGISRKKRHLVIRTLENWEGVFGEKRGAHEKKSEEALTRRCFRKKELRAKTIACSKKEPRLCGGRSLREKGKEEEEKLEHTGVSLKGHITVAGIKEATSKVGKWETGFQKCRHSRKLGKVKDDGATTKKGN